MRSIFVPAIVSIIDREHSVGHKLKRKKLSLVGMPRKHKVGLFVITIHILWIMVENDYRQA